MSDLRRYSLWLAPALIALLLVSACGDDDTDTDAISDTLDSSAASAASPGAGDSGSDSGTATIDEREARIQAELACPAAASDTGDCIDEYVAASEGSAVQALCVDGDDWQLIPGDGLQTGDECGDDGEVFALVGGAASGNGTSGGNGPEEDG